MILVTGGAGFIGSNVLAALAERGMRVAVCDTFGTIGKWRNLAKAELTDIIAPEQTEAMIDMGAISATAATDWERPV